MNKSKLILFICLLNPSFILMLNLSKEYLIDTCCSLNENDRILLSCGLNEIIRLNLIQIYYNANEYCSSELYCCKYQTNCSRRITKYSNLNCDEKNSCWIDRTCLKIYESCSSIYGLYGQYITINYSCLTLNSTDYISYQPVPFILKVLRSEETTKENSLIKGENVFISPNWKSSPIFLIILILFFLFLMLISYCLADQIGQKVCRQNSLKKPVKTNSISRKLVIESPRNEKVESSSHHPSLPITRIYPSQSISQYNNPRKKYSYNPYQRYVNLQYHPTNGQIYSTTFYNYYPN